MLRIGICYRRTRQRRIVAPGVSRLRRCCARMQWTIRWRLVIRRVRQICLAELRRIHAAELQVRIDCRLQRGICMPGRIAVALRLLSCGHMIMIGLGKLQVMIQG